MWTRILLKPFWVRALASAGVLAIVEVADWCARGLPADPHESSLSWLFTLVGRVVALAIFGVLVAAFTSTSNGILTNALTGLDPAQRSAAVAASFRGPVPVDAPVRDAAIRVAWRRLQSARFWRVLWLVLLGLGTLSWLMPRFVWKQGTPGWDIDDWINFAIVLCFTVAAWYVSLSVKHRLQTLGPTQIQSPFGTATSFAPGWYLDPHDRNLMRYFDGRMWTSSTHPRSH
jgi:hypothetical protein